MQVPECSTQLSVAMSSQRTAQYHWGSTPHQFTERERQLPAHLGHPHPHQQLPAAAHGAGGSVAASQAGHTAGHATAGPGDQQQQQQKPGYAGQAMQHLQSSASGVSADNTRLFNCRVTSHIACLGLPVGIARLHVVDFMLCSAFCMNQGTAWRARRD